MSGRTFYYTAASLDGFIADPADSLEWLFAQRNDPASLLGPEVLISSAGSLIMGATTYRWLHQHLGASGDAWPYERPTWVMSHRPLPEFANADVRFASGDIREVHPHLLDAADGEDVWVVGGGDLAGQFADAGLLDEVIVSVAPVTLGSGRPLLPRRLQLRVMETMQDVDFVATRFAVERSRSW